MPALGQWCLTVVFPPEWLQASVAQPFRKVRKQSHKANGRLLTWAIHEKVCTTASSLAAANGLIPPIRPLPYRVQDRYLEGTIQMFQTPYSGLWQRSPMKVKMEKSLKSRKRMKASKRKYTCLVEVKFTSIKIIHVNLRIFPLQIYS